MALGLGQLVQQRRDEEEQRRHNEELAKMRAASEVIAREKAKEQAAQEDIAARRDFSQVSTSDVVRERQRPGIGYAINAARENLAPPASYDAQPAWRRTYEAVKPAVQPAAQNVQTWWDSSAPEREIANELFTQRRDQYNQVLRNFGLGKQAEGGAIPGVVGKVAEVSADLGAGAILPALDWTYQTLGAVKIPGTQLTLGQAVGIGEDAFGKVSNRMFDAKREIEANAEYNSVQDYLSVTGQKAQVMFDSFGDFAQYYMDGIDGYNAALTPTPEQLSRNTPEEIAQARALGRFMGYSGVDAAGRAFDELLDSPHMGQAAITRAEQLMTQAEQLPEGPDREALLVMAAQAGAEGVRLRDKTLLEVYDDNQVWWREMAAGLILDPLNLVDAVGAIGKVTGALPGGLSPMGRRAAEAARVGSMAEDAKLGTAANWTGNLVDTTISKWLKTGTSKAKSDSFWLWSGITGSMTDLNTKNDVVQLFDALIRDPVKLAEEGLDINLLTTPGIRAQESFGRFRVGWAGIKDAKFQAASKVIQQDGFLDAVKMLPSMRTTGEVIDKQQFMGDLHGLIGRWAGWEYKVSAMDGIPYAADAVKVVPGQTPGTAALQFMDGKDVIKTTIDMAPQDAQVGLRQAERAMKRGEEYRRNPMEIVADFQRNFFSSLALNANPSSIMRNILGGFGMGMINLEGDTRMFRKLDEQLGYLTAKYGGMMPDLRVATGAGGLPGPTGLNVSSKGYWRGSDLVNKALLGLPEKGRQFRNWSEEAMYTMVYTTGFKQGFESGAKRLEREVKTLVQQYIKDPKVSGPIVDQITSAIIHGDRAHVARVVTDIAQGRPAISLRTLSPAYTEVLTSAQVREVDDLLRGLTPANQGDVLRRIDEIFAEKIGEAVTEVELLQTPKRYYWTVADRVRDRAEMFDNLQRAKNSGRITQQQFDELVPAIKELDRLGTEGDEALLGLLQATYNRPDTMPAVYGAFLNSQKVTERLRELQSDLSEMVWRERDRLIQSGYQGAQLDAEMSRLWEAYYDLYSREAGNAAIRRTNIFRDAYTAIHDGTYKTLPGMSQGNAEEMLKLLGADVDAARALQDLKLAFGKDDPVLFDQMLKAQRAVTDKFVAQMFLAFQANPTMDSLDEYMSAIGAMGRNNRLVAAKVAQAFAPIKAMQAAGVPNDQIPKALWDAARKAHQQWVPAFRKNWERLQVASTRMVEQKLLDSVLEDLRFVPTGGQDSYILLNKSTHQGWYWAKNERTGAVLHMRGTGPMAVPQAAIDALPKAKKSYERAIAEQVAQLANTAGVKGTGIADLDRMIDDVTRNPLNDVYRQIKENIADHIANNRPTVVVPGHMDDYVIDTLQAAQYALHQAVPQVLKLSGQGYGQLGPNFIGAFNGKILPQFDNLLTQADRTGKAAASLSMVNYLNNYWPDAVLGMFAPYHFWFTRMAKNSLEQAIFNPKITANMSRLYNRVFAENQQNDVPNRNMFQIPGIGFDMNEAYVGFDLPFAQWIPIFPLMVQYGWADPNRTNAAYEYLTDNMTEAGWPGSKNKLLGNALLAAEVGKRFGVGIYPWQDAALGVMAGLRGEANLGSLGPIPRMLGNAGVMFSQYLQEKGQPGAANFVEGVTSPMRPFYEPYLVGRQAVFNAGQGKMTDIEAQNVQDVGYQKFFGAEPLPEQLPGAEQMYQQTRGQVSQDYFWRQFLGWLFPTRFTANYHGEQELNQAAQMRREMGYEPDANRGGSRESQLAMYDMTPGLSAKSSAYATTAESAPQTPDPNAKRPGISAAQAAFFDQREAIYAKYAQPIDDAFAKYPTDSKQRSAILTPLYQERQAELDALAAQYPSIQDIEAQPPNAPNKLVGTNPTEALDIAKNMVVRMAKEANAQLDPGDYPTDGSRSQKAAWRQQNDAYQAAVATTMAELMQRPDIGAVLTPGRELPGAGVMPPAPTGGPVPAPTGAPVPPFGQTTGAPPWQPPGTQTQAYGNVTPYYTSKGFAGHEGVDYVAPAGTPVQAAASGTVTFAGTRDSSAAYGNLVVIRHADGKETWYAHLDGVDVKAGQTVKAGDVVGGVGQTGSGGNGVDHLHFAVRDPELINDEMKGFIDPQVWLQGMEASLPTPVGIALAQPVPGQGQPAPSPANNIAWGQTPEQMLQAGKDKYKGAAQLASEQATEQMFADQAARLQATYPDYVQLKAQWDATDDPDREAFRNANPEIRAVNFLLYQPDAWQAVEKKFGQGSVLLWARRPAYKEGDPGRANYYRQNPDAFLVAAWISGRPTARTEAGEDDNDYQYNLGKDYAEAEKLFGPDIWQTVRQAKALPAYVPGDKASGAAWSAFYKANPSYDAWKDWWYANLPEKYGKKEYTQYSAGTFRSFGSSSFKPYTGGSGYSGPGPAPFRRSYPTPEPAAYKAPSGMGSDWEAWLRRARGGK